MDLSDLDHSKMYRKLSLLYSKHFCGIHYSYIRIYVHNFYIAILLSEQLNLTILTWYELISIQLPFTFKDQSRLTLIENSENT